MVGKKFIVQLTYFYLFFSSSFLGSAKTFQNELDHCLAWQAEKSFLIGKNEKIIGKNCNIKTSYKKENEFYSLRVEFSLNDFNSGSESRDLKIIKDLSILDSKKFFFETEKLTKKDLKILFLSGKGELKGQLFLKEKKYELKVNFMRYHVEERSFIRGSVSTSFKFLDIKPPDEFFLLGSFRDKLNFYYQFEISKLKNIEDILDKRFKKTSILSKLYDINCQDIENKNLNLHKFKDHHILFVNIASQCGYTGQLGALQKLYEKYKSQKFTVLAVPSNQFYQEPLNDISIGDFCKRNYGVSFPILKKSDVNGVHRHKIYTYLIDSMPAGKRHNIKWNFEKFLIAPEGKFLGRYSSSTSIEVIEKVLINYLK